MASGGNGIDASSVVRSSGSPAVLVTVCRTRSTPDGSSTSSLSTLSPACLVGRRDRQARRRRPTVARSSVEPRQQLAARRGGRPARAARAIRRPRTGSRPGVDGIVERGDRHGRCRPRPARPSPSTSARDRRRSAAAAVALTATQVDDDAGAGGPQDDGVDRRRRSPDLRLAGPAAVASRKAGPGEPGRRRTPRSTAVATSTAAPARRRGRSPTRRSPPRSSGRRARRRPAPCRRRGRARRTTPRKSSRSDRCDASSSGPRRSMRPARSSAGGGVDPVHLRDDVAGERERSRRRRAAAAPRRRRRPAWRRRPRAACTTPSSRAARSQPRRRSP